MKKYFVYKITNLINKKIYIGKAINIKNRWNKHKRAAAARDPKDFSYLHRAMNKYGFDQFIIEKLEELNSETEALESEIKYIKLYNSNNKNIGYNLTEGGEGSSGFKHSEKSKIKISINNIKISPNQEKEIVSLYLTGNFLIKDLAQLYDVCSHTLRKTLQKNKIKTIFRPTKDQELEIVKEYQNGKLIKNIAKNFDCNTAIISVILQRNGIVTQFRPSEEKKLEVVKKYIAGKTISDLAKEYHCVRPTITKIVKSFNLSIKLGRKKIK